VAKSDVRGLDTLTKSYADAVRRLVSSGRYDTKKDFTVVIQPFLRDMTARKFRVSFTITAGLHGWPCSILLSANLVSAAITLRFTVRSVQFASFYE